MQHEAAQVTQVIFVSLGYDLDLLFDLPLSHLLVNIDDFN